MAASRSISRFASPRIALTPRLLRPVVFDSSVAPSHKSSFAPPSERTSRAHSTSRQCLHANTWRARPAQQPQNITSILSSHRHFSATSARPKDHHFDTLKFVQRLKDEGFTEEQAVAMMRVLSDVIEESIQNLTRTMVLREEQEKATYNQRVDFAKLRSELQTADSTESSLTRVSHERLTNELAKLNSRLRDEVQRTQASVRLDLNLEKGRIREEANVQELKLKETETRIEQETAQLRERLETVKFQTLQWLVGVCTGAAALMLGVWRILM
ncbi:DUF1640-domain-containing protein [Karstenula rhodostoma CBS 690.94]|uniref:DUF1640-domain-containing protein n=1 Tax=Karstenula rhodostoma CBS 690.94 TaxID=1392251 RepID=A0A9P4U9G0_9PLEO|nr:DUF1640-domain-containing protein [Karstenula rhodostoma CBS 690.94]